MTRTSWLSRCSQALDAAVRRTGADRADQHRALERYRLGVGITPYTPPSHRVTDEEPSSTDAVPALTSSPRPRRDDGAPSDEPKPRARVAGAVTRTRSSRWTSEAPTRTGAEA